MRVCEFESDSMYSWHEYNVCYIYYGTYYLMVRKKLKIYIKEFIINHVLEYPCYRHRDLLIVLLISFSVKSELQIMAL